MASNLNVKCYWYDEYDTPSPTDTRTVLVLYEIMPTVHIRSIRIQKDYEKRIITITFGN